MAPSLQDTFELRGRFWLPDAPEDVVVGTLRFTPQRIELALHGAFSRDGQHVDKAETIMGLTHEGECTVRGAVQVESHIAFTAGGEVEDTSWWARLLVTGIAYDAPGEFLAEGCAFGFDLLEPWLATRPFDVSFSGNQGAASAVQVREPVVSVALGDDGGRLTVSSSWSFGGDAFRKLEWERRSAMTLWAPAPAELDWFLDQLADLRALLALLVGEPVVPTRITALVEGGVHELGVFVNVVGGELSTQISPGQMVITRPAIGDRLEPLVQAWFAKREDLRPSVSLLFGILYLGDALPPEFRFLALTQALETYHRRRYGGAYMADEDYEAVRKTLVQAIPETVASDHRDALKSRLKYGNEFSQRRRFRDLLKSLDDDAIAASAQSEAFLDRVVDHRNYLTHYPAGESPPMTATESVYATFRLRALLWFVLLEEVGITGTEAVEGVRRAPWHSGYVG